MKKLISFVLYISLLVILLSCNQIGLDRELFEDLNCKHNLVYTVSYSSNSLKPDYPDTIIETCANANCLHRATLQIVTDKPQYQYTGSEITPVTIVTSEDWLGTESVLGKIIYKNNVKATNAGMPKPTATVTLYGVKLVKQFEITKKKLPEPYTPYTSIGFINDYIRFIDGSSLQNYNPLLMTASGDLVAKEIGSYIAKFELKDKDNYCWENHSSDYIVEIPWKIKEGNTGGMTVTLPEPTGEVPAGSIVLTTQTDTFVLSFDQTNKDNAEVNYYNWSLEGVFAKEGGDGVTAPIDVQSFTVDKNQLNVKLHFYGDDAYLTIHLTVMSDKGSNTFRYRLYKEDLDKLS